MNVLRVTQIKTRALEERLASPGPGESKESLGLLFAIGFREFGSSGRVVAAAMVLGAFGGVAQCPSRARITLEGFRTERFAPNVVLATYLAHVRRGPGWKPPTLRNALGCKRDDRWRVALHHGTSTAAAFLA
jgi:hypothetical protein